MKITVQDKSNYLKGLLIIAKKDNQLSDSEKKIIRGVGEKLGFASDFYEDILKNLLVNKYIPDDPIKFSHIRIAKSFVDDGLKLIFSDDKVSDTELNWLRETSKENNIELDWFDEKFDLYKNSTFSLLPQDFALFSIIG